MFHVMLVDDEESVLKMLQQSVDWQSMGVDTLLTASNGRRALEAMERRPIDLVITDVRMPEMNGIDLIRNARALNPHMHFIILSAYDNFEYAKAAIQLGIDNYLLKPVAVGELVQSVRSALDNVYRNRNNDQPLLLENTLRRWTAGTINAEELSERASILQINLYQPLYCVITIEGQSGRSTAPFRSACNKWLSGLYDTYHCWDERGRYNLLLGGKEFAKEAMRDKLRALIDNSGQTDVVRLAIGPIVNEAELLNASYRAACDALDAGDPQADRVIVCLNAEINNHDVDRISEEIRLLLFEQDYGRRMTALNNTAKDLCYRYGDAAHVYAARACAHVLADEMPFERDAQEQIFGIARLDTETQKTAMTRTFSVLNLCSEIFWKRYSEYSEMVRRTLQYVHRSVVSGSPVSLKVFCADEEVTPAHLGHSFKKETGIFFNDYVMARRIGRAVLLLNNPNSRIKDISDAVGFTSSSYFVRCFREQKGVSPARYRLGPEEDD